MNINEPKTLNALFERFITTYRDMPMDDLTMGTIRTAMKVSFYAGYSTAHRVNNEVMHWPEAQIEKHFMDMQLELKEFFAGVMAGEKKP